MPTWCSPGLDLLHVLFSLQPSEVGAFHTHFTDVKTKAQEVPEFIQPLVCHSGAALTSLAPPSQHQSWTAGFPGGTVVKNPPANAGDAGSIPGLGRSPMGQSD